MTALAPEVLTALGGVTDDIDAAGYDELVLTPAHLGEFLSGTLKNGLPTFGGIKISSSPHVPAGFGVMRSRGQVVGVMDFANNRTVLLGKAKT